MLLTACAHQGTILKGDFIARDTVPTPLWIPDKVADSLAALPDDPALDAWLILYSTQQQQLEAIHGNS
jgi:hypothetical protein